jgi:hypothetical protein
MPLRIACALALAAGLTFHGAPLHAEVQAWDAARVSALAVQLRTATRELYDTFYKQPKVGVGQHRAYDRLEQDVRRLRSEAKQLSEALAAGAGQEETLPLYEDLMQAVRRARTDAASVFTTQDVQQRASAARQILNEIAPYYDPDASPLQPAAR